MQDYEIEAIRKAYSNSSWQDISDARDRALKFPKAAEAAELLQQLLEEKLADEEKQKQSSAEWSKANPTPERTKTLTLKERKAKELEHLKKITKDGTVIPFVAPPPAYANQADYDVVRRSYEGARPVISLAACPHCTPNSKASDCTGACEDPSFWSARRVSQQELEAIEQRRLANEKQRVKQQ